MKISNLYYRVATLKWDKVQNWLLMKKTQFFSEYHETWSILLPHEYIILTKFHNVWRKIVVFYYKPNLNLVPLQSGHPVNMNYFFLQGNTLRDIEIHPFL